MMSDVTVSACALSRHESSLQHFLFLMFACMTFICCVFVPLQNDALLQANNSIGMSCIDRLCIHLALGSGGKQA